MLRVSRRRVGPLLPRDTGLPRHHRGPRAGFTSWSSRPEPGGENEAASASIPQPCFRVSLSFLGFRTCFSKERSEEGVAGFSLLRRLVLAETVWRRSGVVSGVPGGMETSEEKQRDSISGFLPEEGN